MQINDIQSRKDNEKLHEENNRHSYTRSRSKAFHFQC